MMRIIDMQSWSRREHFEAYNAAVNPHFSLCAQLELTAYYRAVKERGLSFNIATVYALSRAANAVPEFRQRIRGETVVEHAVVHPSTTILLDEEVFSFCTIEYSEDFGEFSARAAERIAEVRAHPTLKDDPDRDDYLFMTALPWIAFTSFGHPGNLHASKSIPQLAWGKRFEEGESYKMPVSIQVHHAIVDGVHAGRFYERLRELFDRPEILFGEVDRAENDRVRPDR